MTQENHSVSNLKWKSPPYPSRSRGINSWSRRLRLGPESGAVSAMVWKTVPSTACPGKSRRVPLGCQELFLGRAVATLVWKIAPPLLSLRKPRRIRCDREELFLGRVVSALVWKIAPYPPWSEKSCRLYPGLESRTISISGL